MTLLASSAGTSWLTKGSEAAVITIFIDGNYNQDVILFAGEKAKLFQYGVFLGKFETGNHKVDITLNRERSPGKIKKDSIAEISFEIFATSSNQKNADDMARQYSPFIYARPNSIDKFSDIPLIVYYEILDGPSGSKRIIYSVIFSHEDGGTRGKALMARWGRMTDIEWIYEVNLDANGNKITDIYQGANHETKTFEGKRAFGLHPLFYNATDNNNFADSGCSSLRFAPSAVRADLSKGSRETLMEKFPWTYRIMSEEIIRENRIGNDPKDADKIFDPRDYAYVEIYAEQSSTAISVELDSADGKTNSSDLGIRELRVARKGYFRIAILNPTKDFPKFVRLRCHAAGEAAKENCKSVRVVKVVMLDETFLPKEIVFPLSTKQIKPGNVVIISRE